MVHEIQPGAGADRCVDGRVAFLPFKTICKYLLKLKTYSGIATLPNSNSVHNAVLPCKCDNTKIQG